MKTPAVTGTLAAHHAGPSRPEAPGTAKPPGWGKMILLKTGLATGTTFSNTATVVFDTNAPLNTNAVTNTVDAGAPTSTVSPLPADYPPQFTVVLGNRAASNLRVCMK